MSMASVTLSKVSVGRGVNACRRCPKLRGDNQG